MNKDEEVDVEIKNLYFFILMYQDLATCLEHIIHNSSNFYMNFNILPYIGKNPHRKDNQQKKRWYQFH